MGHPMENYWLGERMEREGRGARYEKVLQALRDVPLSEFTVGQLHDIHCLVTRKWDSNEVVARLEQLVEERHRLFKHGMYVRYRKPKRGQKGLGIVTSYPRRGTRLVYVQGPRGWAGWTHVDELEIVRP